MQQQRRRDEKVNQKVRQLQLRLQEASPEDYRVTEELDEMLRSYQQQQEIRATCVVVDMVCFYYSIDHRIERGGHNSREKLRVTTNHGLHSLFFLCSLLSSDYRICFTWPANC